jgi:hypothetical protein
MDALSFSVQFLTSLTMKAFQQNLGLAILFTICVMTSVLVFLRTRRTSVAATADQLDNQTRPADREVEAPPAEPEDAIVVKPRITPVANQRYGLWSSARALGLGATGLWGLLCGLEHLSMPTVLRQAHEAIEKKTGVELQFQSSTGGFLQGELVLHEVRISRKGHPQSNFDLRCDEVRIRCSVWTALYPGKIFKELQLAKVTGTYELLRRNAPSVLVKKNNAPAPDLDQRLRSIEIGHLRIEDALIHFVDRSLEGEPIELEVTLKTLDCPAFRTDRAAFDICFRSQVDGLLDGQEFHAVSTETKAGIRTDWKGTKLPLKLARKYLAGPFRWLSQGSFDFQAAQLVRLDPSLQVQFKCDLVLNDVEVEAPEGVKPAVAIGAQVLIAYLKQQDRPVALSFQTEHDRKRFDLRTTESVEHFWAQVQRAAVSALLKATTGNKVNDDTVDAVSDLATRAIEKIKERRKARREGKLKP